MSGRNTAGVHYVVDGSHDYYGTFLERCAAIGHPAGLVKSFFDKGALGQAKSVSRDTFTIYRCSIDDNDFPPTENGSWFWQSSAACRQSAYDWMRACDALWNGERENVDAFELVNEPNPVDEQIAWFLEWSRNCLEFAEVLGYRIGWGAFSMGCPSDAQMLEMLPFVDDLAKRGHILTLHDGAEGEPTTDAALTSTLRYRWWKHQADVAGLQFPKVAITECYSYGKQTSAFWENWRWYLSEMSKDAYVLGAAWYTLGNGGMYGNIAGRPLEYFTDMAISIDWDSIIPEPPAPPEPEQPIILNVPYLSQTSINADLSYNDCGPACEAMVARYLTGDTRSVNDWYVATGAGLGYISIAELAKAAQVMGYTLNVLRSQSLDSLRVALGNGKPAILLVNPVGLRACGTTAPHFIVAAGFSTAGPSFYCHDPYFLEGGIGGPMIEQPTLAEAWSRCHEQGNPDWLMMTMDKGAIPPPSQSVWRGLQLRNGDNTTDDWACVMEGKLDAVKFTTDTAFYDLDYACTLVTPSHILLRLFADLSERVVQPQEFASWYTAWLDKFASIGGQYVEVHNEPNLTAEGLGLSWQNGVTFASWLISVLTELRRIQPALKYGFPGLSPGGSVSGVRMDEMTFYNEAKPAVELCDWIGVHCYWVNTEGMAADSDGGHYKAYQSAGKPLMITEFSNPNSSVSKFEKGWEYKLYYTSLPGYVIGAYSFISSADNPMFASETWAGSEIAEIVGA